MERQEFHLTFRQNLAFAKLATMHPEMIQEIDNAWGEHLEECGWTREDFGTEVLRFRQQITMQEALTAEELTPEIVQG